MMLMKSRVGFFHRVCIATIKGRNTSVDGEILFGQQLLLSSPPIFFKKISKLPPTKLPPDPISSTPAPPRPVSSPSLGPLLAPSPPRLLSDAAPFPLPGHSPRSPVFSPLRLLPLPQHPLLSGPQCLPALEHRPSLAPHLSGTVRSNRPNERPSFGLFGQTEGLCLAKQVRIKALCSVMVNEGPLFGQIGPNRGPLFGPIWLNDVESKAGAGEGGAGLMPRSGEETGPKGEGAMLGRGGDEGGAEERGEGGGQEMGRGCGEMKGRVV